MTAGTEVGRLCGIFGWYVAVMLGSIVVLPSGLMVAAVEYDERPRRRRWWHRRV